MPIKNNEPNRVQAINVRDLVVGMKVLTPIRGSTGVMVLGVRTITKLVEEEDMNDSLVVFKTRRLVFGNKHALLKSSAEVIILAEEEPDEV
jgi:hypothetical protein